MPKHEKPYRVMEAESKFADGGVFKLKNYLKVWDEHLLNQRTSIC